MSEIKVNKISPKQTCTQLTLGDSGDTIIIPAGATITNNGTANGFGRTGSVNWDTTPKTTTVTAVSGVGYFVNTTSGAITVNLPAGVAGDIVAISDYANTAATNNITITPNGTNKINGINQNYTILTNGVSITLLYIDSTRGWKDINDATLDVTGIPPYVAATGGTITTCGDYKIHTFTGPGTFTVTSAGAPAGSTTVDYLVIAGGGAGGAGGGPDTGSGAGAGGGGAGGYRESKATGAPWTASPLATSTSLPVSVTSYPITVGGGATATPPSTPQGTSGTPSVFSTITSTGGGGGGGWSPLPGANGRPGGSGGAAADSGAGATAGSGNTPPVSPPQGNNGGPGTPVNGSGGGGGGATAAGAQGTAAGPNPANSVGGTGGAGATSSINGTPTGRAGGGGGGAGGDVPVGPPGVGGSATNGGGAGGAIGVLGTAGTTNTGGGGGAGGANPGKGGGNGGSGLIIIRYKYQ